MRTVVARGFQASELVAVASRAALVTDAAVGAGRAEHSGCEAHRDFPGRGTAGNRDGASRRDVQVRRPTVAVRWRARELSFNSRRVIPRRRSAEDPTIRDVPETIVTDRRGDVLLITLDRPEKLNAWNTRMGRELSQAIRDANEDGVIGAMVVTGAGRAFCAGADIGDTFADREDLGADSAPGSSGAGVAFDWVELCQRSKPIVAAVNGICIGVGITQILCFDGILASEHARFGIGFIKIGLVPELAATRFLTQRMGPG